MDTFRIQPEFSLVTPNQLLNNPMIWQTEAAGKVDFPRCSLASAIAPRLARRAEGGDDEIDLR
jgi:hypothetical protein